LSNIAVITTSQPAFIVDRKLAKFIRQNCLQRFQWDCIK